MELPFSRAAFLGVFETYNLSIWPAQLGLFTLAIVVLVLVLKQRAAPTRAAMAVLAGLWAWMGIAYHWVFFTPINPAAWVFGAAFVVQALLFAVAATLTNSAEESVPRWAIALGLGLVTYALLVYPVLGLVSDHAYPRSPTFGLPCPTTIFTFGVLLMASGQPRIWLSIIPSLWALVGLSAPFAFGIWEDIGLLVAATVGVVGLLVRSRVARQTRRFGRDLELRVNSVAAR